MKRISWFLLIVLCLFAAGCGSFGGSPYTLSGRVTYNDDSDQGIEGVNLAFTGSVGFGTATTGPDGTWSKSGLKGKITVTPAKSGWAFEPTNKQVNSATESVGFTGSRRLTITPSVKQISANNSHALVVMSNGSVYGWGLSDHGQLGFNGDRWIRIYLMKVPNIDGAVAVAAGHDHSLALLADGTVWAWGGNEHGQLGNGTNTDCAMPTQVANLSGIISIAAGYHFSLALKNDGTVWGWGFNSYNQLGDRSWATQATPVKMITENVVAIAAGKVHSLVLTSDGEARQWGFFPVNPGIDDNWIFSSLRGEPVLKDVIAISTNNYHDMFLKSDGTVWTYGANDYGQLGSGNREWRLTMVSGLDNVVAIAAGFHHSVAMKADGTVWAWGGNGGGQLGIGTISLFEGKPVRVSKIADITMIGAGGNFTAATDKYGKLWYWGLCGVLDCSNYIRVYPIELTF